MCNGRKKTDMQNSRTDIDRVANLKQYAGLQFEEYNDHNTFNLDLSQQHTGFSRTFRNYSDFPSDTEQRLYYLIHVHYSAEHVDPVPETLA